MVPWLGDRSRHAHGLRDRLGLRQRDPALDINVLPIHLALPLGVRRRQLARNLVRDRFRLADEHAVAVPADFECTCLVRC
jgi:hypothetical protein